MRSENLLYEDKEFCNGIRKVYRFKNGYGASVVKFKGSYGYEQNLWELAPLAFLDDTEEICYINGFKEPKGFLSDEQVDKILEDISKWK